ncbi:MAG TPA: S8 family serine peptidase [Gaiellaceae bacterium]
MITAAVVALAAASASDRGTRTTHRVFGRASAIVSPTHVDAVPASVLRAASSVTIAVIDTGADVTAPDIAAKAPATWNTRTSSPDVRDVNGHGTFVASLAAGSVTNGDGIDGAGGDAQLMIVKAVGDGGSFSDADEAAGIVYAVDHGAKILNLSVGGPKTSSTERRAVQYAIDHGVLLVASVGNELQSGNPVEYPAALLQPAGSDGVGGAGLAVTSSTPDGRHASYANTGSWVSVAAPGDHVLGAVSAAAPALTYPREAVPGVQTGLYGYGSGTSFATPLVSGAAALVWAANPGLTAQQVAQILKETASGHGHWTPELGFGVIDAAAAVARAQSGAPGVLLSGSRDRAGAKLAWSGTATAYRLTMATDGRATGPLLWSTPLTSTTVELTKGHRYSFRVTALDASGSPTATSTALTFVVR